MLELLGATIMGEYSTLAEAKKAKVKLPLVFNCVYHHALLILIQALVLDRVPVAIRRVERIGVS